MIKKPKPYKTKTIKEPRIVYIPNTQALKILKLKSHWNKVVNVYVGKKVSETAKNLFFKAHARDDDKVLFLHYKNPNTRWGQILRDLGIAKSTSEAKGAGWDRPVENGFQDIYLDGLKLWKGEGFGRNPHIITILKDKGLK